MKLELGFFKWNAIYSSMEPHKVSTKPRLQYIIYTLTRRQIFDTIITFIYYPINKKVQTTS